MNNVDEVRQEAITLIESIPDDRADILVKIIRGIRELVGHDSQDDFYSRAEHDLAIMEEIETLTRD